MEPKQLIDVYLGIITATYIHIILINFLPTCDKKQKYGIVNVIHVTAAAAATAAATVTTTTTAAATVTTTTTAANGVIATITLTVTLSSNF